MSSARILPRAMMIARLQTASTSSSRCVEITMIFDFAMRADQLADLVLLIRIEAVGRLVEDQHLGVVQDRLREPDAPPVALRQRVDGLLEHAIEMQELRTTSSSRLRRAARRDAARFGDELEERPRRHLGIARRTFGQIADAALRRTAAVSMSEPHTARGRPSEEENPRRCASSSSCRRRSAPGSRAPRRARREAQIVDGAKTTVFFR